MVHKLSPEDDSCVNPCNSIVKVDHSCLVQPKLGHKKIDCQFCARSKPVIDFGQKKQVFCCIAHATIKYVSSSEFMQL